MNVNHNKTKLIALAGLFAALVFVVTLIHVPTGNGYTHAGDGLIYLAACILPLPYAVAASAIGAALADGLSGAVIWIPATVIIKALMAMCFSRKSRKIISVRNMIAVVIAFVINYLGYCIYEAFIFSDGFFAAFVGVLIAGLLPSLIQSAASTVLFIFAGLFLDKSDIKNKINI